MSILGVILAGGKGTRMKTSIPKCAYPFLYEPMIERIVNEVKASKVDDVCVVVGYMQDTIKNILKTNVKYVYQEKQIGTANALLQANTYYNQYDYTIVLPGDIPLINSKIINDLITYHINKNSMLTILTVDKKNPFGYGRIIKTKNSLEIKEEIECNENEKQIKEVNTGIYVFTSKIIDKYIYKITSNNQKNEYYLTDIVKLINKNESVITYKTDEELYVTGVNDLQHLKSLEKEYINLIKAR